MNIVIKYIVYAVLKWRLLHLSKTCISVLLSQKTQLALKPVVFFVIKEH